MIGALPNKTKQFFFLLIKVSIVIGAFYYIYKKLINNEFIKFDNFYQFLIKNDVFFFKNVIFLFILTIFNWFFEILKWRNLVNHCTNISFYTSFKQSLSSLTASLFTPNRIGDYIAKALYYNKTQQKQILLLNLLANSAQMCATILFGSVGLLLFISRYEVPVSKGKLFQFLLLVVLIVSFLGFGYRKRHFNIRGFSLNKMLQYLKSMPLELHLSTLGLSIVRYLVFSFQFYFLLLLFDVEVSYLNAMIIISSMYLLSSLLPSFYIFDVAVKGGVALFLFEIVGVNPFTITTIVLVMWILNFMLPAIVGSFYVLNFKHYNKYNSEVLE